MYTEAIPTVSVYSEMEISEAEELLCHIACKWLEFLMLSYTIPRHQGSPPASPAYLMVEA